ncbi:hypothetical protein TIFTF001_050511 [Ficus carica]|uniref:Cathepsin propeptide inhibitor domain-containing protein n=1 Tax=Ficus carica TaxID=3494 RepID=A0AA87Z240_FICCA|nr:hypothetical protein TIFTF001_050510 [Ficus carica]GMN28071.1 hypothetical protein TIFTF001_050511 [Ficus carica]
MGGLPYALVAASLTCALTLTLTVALEYADDPVIHQVTDECGDNIAHRRYFSGNELLGTEKKFRMLMEKYGKAYGSRKEYVRRLGIFARNMVKAAEHQVPDPTAVHGVTPFSDLSQEAFERSYTGFRGGPGFGYRNVAEDSSAAAAENVEVSGDKLPESFDWREKGAVTDVKMQVSTQYNC